MANSKISAFLVGLLAGAAAGILLAPHKGSKTRKKIYKAGENLLSSAKDKVGGLEDKIKDSLQAVKKGAIHG